MYFNEKMTYHEARNKLYTIVDGKSQSEIERIKEEYSAVVPVITARELKENDGWLTSDPLK